MKYFIISIFCFSLYSCTQNKAAVNLETKKNMPANYQLATVEGAGISSAVKLPAQMAAYEEVSIFPKVNGYVKNVLVDIGSKVSKGSMLMVLEAPELQQASAQAKERYARSKADFSIDREHYRRLLEASNTPGAISALDLSTAKAKMDADSSLSNAESSNWEMQKTMLGYLSVTAPFTGIITERNVDPGALVSNAQKDKPMLELKQVDRLRLQVDIPEDIAGTLKDKDTVSFYTSASPGKKMIGYISRESGNVNMQYRSERMEIDVWNKDGSLAPGMYADVVLYPKGNVNALSVPKSAVVITTEKKYVLTDTNGNIKKVEVSTGNSGTGNIEVYGRLQAGDKVIVNATEDIAESGK